MVSNPARFLTRQEVPATMPPRAQIAPVFARVVGPESRVAVKAYDGSTTNPLHAVGRLVIRDPRALRCIATAPSDLGLARAYVWGYLDVEGDLFATLAALTRPDIGTLTWRERREVLRRLGPWILIPTPPPPEEVRPGLGWGLRHSRGRDSRAISHHYDVSNRFYELILGPTMAYTCAVYPRAGASLEEAQEEKVDLVCRKLDLRPGQRLLDVGCGWGTMVLHAAAHYGVRVIGVTLSRQQAEFGQKRLAELGLSDVAEIRHDDYRHVMESGFDAISSIGLTETSGRRTCPDMSAFSPASCVPRGGSSTTASRVP